MASQFPGGSPITPPPPPYSPPPAGGGLVGRVQRILMQPTAEWQRIDLEPTPAQSVFTSYAVPLATIGPVCSLIGSLLFGYHILGITYRPSPVGAIVSALLTYAAALGGVWILTLVIDALAPSFGSVKSRDQAMKVAAYSYTAAWVAGVFQIIPMLGIIGGLLGLYSFFLLWLGLPRLMRTPPDKAVGYVVVSVIAAIVVYAVLLIVIGTITSALAFNAISGLGSPGAGSLTISGTSADGTSGSVDLGKLAAAGQQMAAASNAAAATHNGTVTINNGKIVDPAALQAMLPASVGGFTRTEVENTGGAAAGIGGATAKGTYKQGDQSFELSVTDVGALGSLATLGGALSANSSKQTATGYEKSTIQNGNAVEEDWDNADHHGKFSTMVASRFAVAAEGSAPSIDPLKAAVASVDMGKLAALAK